METEATTDLAGNSQPTGSPVSQAKPQPVRISLADVLAKKASGETLTPRERGVLGAEKRKALAKLKPAAAAENTLLQPDPAAPAPAPAIPAASDNILLEAETSAPVPAAAGDDTFFDAARCRLAAEALCDAYDTGGQFWIGWEAEQIPGANHQTVARYESAVAMQPRNRKLMVEGSEPVIRFLCRWFKCPPEKLNEAIRGSGFLAGVVCHGLALTAAVKSIHQSKGQPPEAKA